MARILLIEDEESVRYSLRQVLENAGHDVFEACDGRDGVSQFKLMSDEDQSTDVVITDIVMPKKNGYDAIAEIQKISPTTKIIAISGGYDVDPQAILDISNFLGAEQVLAKPFLPEELVSVVDHCLASNHA